MSKSLNRLPFAKKVKIYQYLNARQEWITKSRPTYEKVAKMASEALGFEVAAFTVGDIARNSLEWKWPSPASTNKNKMDVERAKTFNGNAIKYGALVAKVNHLEKQVERLLAELGVK